MVVGVVLAVNLSRSIFDFLRLKSRLVEAEQKLEQLKLEQQGLEKEYSYKTKPEYLEQEVRNKLNMAKPGEMVVIIPESELASAAAISSRSAQDETKETKAMPIWRQWWGMIF